jgi:hypothetical protein
VAAKDDNDANKNDWPSRFVFGIASFFCWICVVVPWIQSTDSFKLAESAIRSSDSVSKHVGEVRRVSIDPLYRIAFEGWGSDFAVDYGLVVSGTMATKTLHIVVSKEGEVWKVERAEFDHEPVLLLPMRLDGMRHSFDTFMF